MALASASTCSLTSKHFAMSCLVASTPIQMGSEFPFDEMLLGLRYILLGQQHALFDSLKLHLLGGGIASYNFCCTRVQSDTISTSSRTRPVMHYDDKFFKYLFFVTKDWYVHNELCKYF